MAKSTFNLSTWTRNDKLTYGECLYREHARYKFSRIPRPLTEYVITTKGLIVRGGTHGEGNPLDYKNIKEPDIQGAMNIGHFSLSGVVEWSTLINLVHANGQDFPGMTPKCSRYLIQATCIAEKYASSPYKEDALIYWSKHLGREFSDSDFKNDLFKRKLFDIYKNANNSNYQTAMEMWERAELEISDLDNKYKLEDKIKDYNKKVKRKAREKRMSGFGEDFLQEPSANNITTNTQSGAGYKGFGNYSPSKSLEDF